MRKDSRLVRLALMQNRKKKNEKREKQAHCVIARRALYVAHVFAHVRSGE
jgi:hypothetical protein